MAEIFAATSFASIIDQIKKYDCPESDEVFSLYIFAFL